MGEIACWLKQELDVPQHPLEPDETARDAALLRGLTLFSVVLLVACTLVARMAFNEGDAWLAVLAVM
jgi:hypothetical protein